MRRCITLVAVAGSLALLHTPVVAQPAEDLLPTESENTGGTQDSDAPTFSGGTTEDGVEAGVGGGSTSGSGGGDSGGNGGTPVGVASYRPQCTWAPADITNTAGTGASGVVPADGSQIENADGELGWLRRCGTGSGEFVWLAPAVDPIDLVPGTAARARARLPVPEPDMSPAADVGSVVNLGVWFSIDDPGITTARATLGTAWAQVQGTFESVTIDPGDGSPAVTCDGFGTPYPDGSNDPDEGPCGHTYLERTPDDAPHQMTYTITYEIDWATSDGRSGSLGTFDRSTTFDYDIDEIQTVGTNRDS